MLEYALAAIPGNSPPGNIVMDEFAHEFFLTSLDEAATGNGTTNPRPQAPHVARAVGFRSYGWRAAWRRAGTSLRQS